MDSHTLTTASTNADFIDVPAAAWQVQPGDRLVPESGTVRVAVEVDHHDRSRISMPGFDTTTVWDLDPHDPVTLRCPTEPTPGWSYFAGQAGFDLPCSCVYRWDGGAWVRAITLPNCAWCNPNEED